MARFVGAWLGRAFLVLAAILFLSGPPDPVVEAPLGAEFYIIGTAFAAGALATFRRTSKVGWALVLFAVWAMFTWYGVIALFDPFSVIADSQRSGYRAPHLTSDRGSYVVGAVVLAVANVPVAAWLWSKTSWATDRRQRHRDAILRVGGAPTVAAPEARRQALQQDRRRASRRRRKRRLKRR